MKVVELFRLEPDFVEKGSNSERIESVVRAVSADGREVALETAATQKELKGGNRNRAANDNLSAGSNSERIESAK